MEESYIEQGNNEIINVKKLDVDEISPRNLEDPDGGGIYLVVGPSGSGKTNIIKSLIYGKSHFIPSSVVISESEEYNGTYKKILPELFIHDKLTGEFIAVLETRQLIALNQKIVNPYTTLVLDDCMNKRRNMADDVYTKLFKTGRHQKVYMIVAMQHVGDISQTLKNQCAGVFLLKNANEDTRKKLYDNFGGVFASKKLFDAAMDSLTTDYSALFINSRCASDNWLDKIRWFKAYDNLDDIKWNACNKDAQLFSNVRYDINTSQTKTFLLKQ